MKNMKPRVFFLFISISLEELAVSVTGNNIGAYSSSTNDIAINYCSPSNSSVSDWTWIRDAADEPKTGNLIQGRRPHPGVPALAAAAPRDPAFEVVRAPAECLRPGSEVVRGSWARDPDLRSSM
ncbi:hypothetical protein NL676_005292 [Syzygium grande]|nr:hypothetical protein NL676_005292 [Syzygium grande]